ncbi:S-adenosyl-L-methionine-dependent methyltransferase [Xylaria sp. FL0064]|nr:S-adenosyl-L-methionine-dependent methyltransferase [Xylaria sp. FL0064]
MPRLAPSLFRRAGRISPHLATLLLACRTLESAQIELRWIRRYVQETTCRTQSAQNNPNNTNEGSKNNGAALFPRNGEDPRRHRAKIKARGKSGANSSSSKAPSDEDRVARLVARRGAGEPLQYVLGTQPFGDLEILCEKGVLIPRPETEAWASMLADLVFSSSEGRRGGKADGLQILDLCSGTGCIGLSLYARGVAALGRAGYGKGENTENRGVPLRLFGFDVEPRAVRLARRNLVRNFSGSRHGAYRDNSGLAEEALKGAITFRQADIFADEWMAYLDEAKPREYEKGDKHDQARRVDILVSNPPYISQRGFEVDTGRSVRNYEPKLALVPSGVRSSLSTATIPTSAALSSCAPEDIFYAHLLNVADTLRPRIAVFEVGDLKQAIRVAEMALSRSRSRPRSNIEKVQKGEGDEPMGQTEARWDIVEIWRDVPDCQPSDAEEDVIFVRGREVPVRGSGHGRVVFLAEGQMMRNRFTNRGFRQEVYTGS